MKKELIRCGDRLQFGKPKRVNSFRAVAKDLPSAQVCFA
jgi:hypothetical protein